MPPEVQFSLSRDTKNNLYFSISDVRWIEKFFNGGKDGIAVDVLSTDQLPCDGKNKLNESWLNMGTLIGPFFYKDFKDDIQVTEYNHAVVKLGKVPASVASKDIEFNLILLDNSYICYYQRFYDLERYKWDLLDMGLYMDTIQYGVKYDTTTRTQNTTRYHTSRMKFVIPFEKNKWEYKAKDLQSFYDSLQLDNFTIKKIELRAYASVEGTTERNLELQNKRAKSIVEVLQEKQLETIDQKITTSENWVEFYTDISGTQHAYLGNLSKSEIKEKLNNRAVLESIEPILSQHRKAVLLLDVERKTTLNEDKEQLITALQQALKENNVEQAAALQQSIFSKVMNQQFPEDVLNEIKIPRQNTFGVLINNEIAFKHFLDPEDVLESYKEFQELDQLIPNNKKVKYNLCAMKFRVWILGLDEIDPNEFEKEINALKKLGISNRLVKRMLVNLNIIMSEYYTMVGDYANKDQALSYIKKNYRYIDMKTTDLLSLAQYFSAYARYDWATKLLTPKVQTIDADEDLLFYYINLTIVEPTMLKRSSYRTILQNAISINRDRFCKLFQTIEKGGISFQMLMEETLKTMYCEDCQGKWM